MSLSDSPSTIELLRSEFSKLSLESAKLLRDELVRIQREGESGRRFYSLYPAEGPLSRDKYSKHLRFFEAGIDYQERAMLGGNRTGKSMAIAFELTAHMTGEYPDWWPGRRFNRSVAVWVAGEDVKALRDSLQVTLFGPDEGIGSGMIPRKNLVDKPTSRAGVAGAYDTFKVRHKEGGISYGVLKTYDMGRESFQAAAVDVVALDEEPPIEVYTECLLRTMATVPGQPNGTVIAAFTPLKGLSDVVLSYLPHMVDG